MASLSFTLPSLVLPSAGSKGVSQPHSIILHSTPGVYDLNIVLRNMRSKENILIPIADEDPGFLTQDFVSGFMVKKSLRSRNYGGFFCHEAKGKAKKWYLH